MKNENDESRRVTRECLEWVPLVFVYDEMVERMGNLTGVAAGATWQIKFPPLTLGLGVRQSNLSRPGISS
jgi:hypothetical protein